MFKRKRPAKVEQPTYEQLGQMLVSIYESGYIDRKQTYKMSFIKGMLGGLGGVVGATVLVVILLWVLSLFSHVPLVGRFTDNIHHTLQTKK